MALRKDYSHLVGSRFGRLTVTALDHPGAEWMAICACDCGTTKTIRLLNVTKGASKSCGCLLVDWCRESKRTHGLTNSSEYGIWRNIKSRCCNPNIEAFQSYGARGITVCPEWMGSFDAFYRDVGPRPSPLHEIDRENNDGNYEPGNCRWVRKAVNVRNRRVTKFAEAFGERLSIPDWAERLGIKYKLLWQSLNRGQTIEQISRRYAEAPGITLTVDRA